MEASLLLLPTTQPQKMATTTKLQQEAPPVLKFCNLFLLSQDIAHYVFGKKTIYHTPYVYNATHAPVAFATHQHVIACSHVGITIIDPLSHAVCAISNFSQANFAAYFALASSNQVIVNNGKISQFDVTTRETKVLKAMKAWSIDCYDYFLIFVSLGFSIGFLDLSKLPCPVQNFKHIHQADIVQVKWGYPYVYTVCSNGDLVVQHVTTMDLVTQVHHANCNAQHLDVNQNRVAIASPQCVYVYQNQHGQLHKIFEQKLDNISRIRLHQPHVFVCVQQQQIHVYDWNKAQLVHMVQHDAPVYDMIVWQEHTCNTRMNAFSIALRGLLCDLHIICKK